MTISPIRFGHVYPITGNAADRKQARTDITAFAQQNNVDVEVLADLDDGMDLYFTNDSHGNNDADTFRANKDQVTRYFELRKASLDTHTYSLNNALSAAPAPAAPAHKKCYEDFIQAQIADEAVDHLAVLAKLFGFSEEGAAHSEKATKASQSVKAGNFQAEWGYA